MMTGRGRLVDDGRLARDSAEQALFAVVGAFLQKHHLPPSPSNYAVAHAFVVGSNEALVRAVQNATYGGLRLSQADADGLAAIAAAPSAAVAVAVAVPAAAAVSSAAASVVDLVHAIDQARDRFDRYAGIVDSSRQDAQAYGAALATGAATMAPAASAASGAETVAVLLALTESMITKTRNAEEQLRAASVEMDDLRANLAVARQDAETDPLTGLPNRRAFEACFVDCSTVAQPRTVSLALCDIDLFKGVNDRHGHDVGDRVIRLVAKELAQGCDGCVVARYGGEEFAVLFEGRDMDFAAQMLDRTRDALNGRSFRVAGTGERLDGLSFSGGVVAVAPGEDCRAAIKRADSALYRAKQSGRNRIEQGD